MAALLLAATEPGAWVAHIVKDFQDNPSAIVMSYDVTDEAWVREHVVPLLAAQAYIVSWLRFKHPERDRAPCHSHYCDHMEHWTGRRLMVRKVLG